jgi:tRNA U55 pseudouridine synthase TruB
MGNQLGTGAYMSDLRRTKIARYDITDAISLENLTFATIAAHLITLA